MVLGRHAVQDSSLPMLSSTEDVEVQVAEPWYYKTVADAGARDWACHRSDHARLHHFQMRNESIHQKVV